MVFYGMIYQRTTIMCAEATWNPKSGRHSARKITCACVRVLLYEEGKLYAHTKQGYIHAQKLSVLNHVCVQTQAPLISILLHAQHLNDAFICALKGPFGSLIGPQNYHSLTRILRVGCPKQRVLNYTAHTFMQQELHP